MRPAGWVAFAVIAALVLPQPGLAGRSGAEVDPLLLAEYRTDLAPIAVLVVEPQMSVPVVSRLHALGIEAYPYEHLDMVQLRLPKPFLPTVAGWPEVRTVWRNEHMHPYLDKSARYIGADVVWNTYRVRGDGITVLVVDTGVDGSHPDVRYGENLIENVVPTRLPTGLIGGQQEGVVSSDADGHGTHVAGIVAGMAKAVSGDAAAGRYKGIANGARLIGFEAGLPDADGEPSFDTITVLKAYDYALAHQHQYNIRVVTNSWGANGDFEPQSPVNAATLRLYLGGMVVPFAAGNEGSQGPGSLNRYSVAPWVLSVGAGNYLNQRASFSSIGSEKKPYDHPDLLAPGAQITSAKAAGDSGAAGGLPDLTGATAGRELYVTKSGSSMAAPHVAGTAALLLSKNPKLSPDDVYDILTASATPLPSLPRVEGGAGYLSAFEAYRVAQTVPGSLDTFLQGRVKYAGHLSGDPDYSDDAVSVGLGNGAAKEVRGADTTPAELARGLVSTPTGLVFLIALPLLLLFAFRRDEGRWVRRGGVATRPLAVGGAWFLFLLAAFYAPRWIIGTSLYTGNVLVQVLIPDRLFDLSALPWLLAVIIGLGLLVWSMRPGAKRVLYGPLLLLGLLLVLYGFLYMANARFTADRAPGGYALFVSLNYADLLSRPLQAILGLVLLLGGAVALGASVGPRQRPVPAQRQEPRRPGPVTQAAPAPPRAAHAATR